MRPSSIFALVLILAVAGCVGGTDTGERARTDHSPKGTITVSTTPVDGLTQPTPPAELTNETAKEVALDAEEAFVHARLRTSTALESFSVREGYTTSTEARVINETDGGVYVRVRMPYSYSTEDAEADSSTVSVYFVTTETVRRVRGDDVPNVSRSKTPPSFFSVQL